MPQIPSIQFWRGSGGGTSERGEESATPDSAINDKHGNLMVVMTHDTDIADSWEREGEDPASSTVLAGRLRARHQRPPLRDDALSATASDPAHLT